MPFTGAEMMSATKIKLQERWGIDLDLVGRELCVPSETVARVIRNSLASTEDSLEQLSVAIAGGDSVAVGRISHELRGVYANLRIAPLVDVARRMEETVRSDVAEDGLSGLLAEFRDKFGALKDIFG